MPSQLGYLNRSFFVNSEDCERSNVLLKSLKKEASVTIFHLTTAAISFRYDYFNAQFNDFLSYFPNAGMYYRHIYKEELPADTVRTFFHRLKDIKWNEFLNSKANTDSELIDELMKECRIEKKIFKRLLYFSLITGFVKVNLEDISHKCFERLTLSSKCKVFSVQNTNEKDWTFKGIAGDIQVVYHGTFEQNVYSILRNGIQPNKFSGVAMTTSVTTALTYTENPTRVVLIYEAKHLLRHKVLSEEDGYSMPTSKVILRCVVWLTDCEEGLARQVVKRAVVAQSLGGNSWPWKV